MEQEGSSVMDGWSVDESVEGLRSKLERWRAEAPAMYDQAGYATTSGSFRSGSYMGRQTDGGGENPADGLFSCFGNMFGYECECVCGQPPTLDNNNNNNNNNDTNNNNYICRSPSVGGSSFL